MPIASMQSALQSQIYSALSMGPGAKISTTAQIITSGISSTVSVGIIPGTPPTPTTPTGFSSALSQIETALSMGPGAKIPSVAQQIATAVSVIAPIIPPSGLAALQSQLQAALSLGPSAVPMTFSQLMSTAVISYFLAGGAV